MLNNWCIVWLDANAFEQNNSFRAELPDQTAVFNDVNKCIRYIESEKIQNIFVIVSGSFVKELIPTIYPFDHVLQIYIFCGFMGALTDWAIDFIDKLSMFDHGDDLLERLWMDLSSKLDQQAAFYHRQADEMKQRSLKYKQKCG